MDVIWGDEAFTHLLSFHEKGNRHIYKYLLLHLFTFSYTRNMPSTTERFSSQSQRCMKDHLKDPCTAPIITETSEPPRSERVWTWVPTMFCTAAGRVICIREQRPILAQHQPQQLLTIPRTANGCPQMTLPQFHWPLRPSHTQVEKRQRDDTDDDTDSSEDRESIATPESMDDSYDYDDSTSSTSSTSPSPLEGRDEEPTYPFTGFTNAKGEMLFLKGG